MKHDPTFWILARASGLTAYGLLATTTVGGLVLRSRLLGKLVKPAALTDAHRFLALLALAAIGMHGAALVLDSTVHVDLLGLLVPGRVAYRPFATGAGVVAAELVVLVYVSFPARKLIGVANWRRLHWLTYVVFVAATAHGLLAGSDSGHAWARYLYLAAIAAVTAGTVFRAVDRGAARPKRTVAAARAETAR